MALLTVKLSVPTLDRLAADADHEAPVAQRGSGQQPRRQLLERRERARLGRGSRACGVWAARTIGAGHREHCDLKFSTLPSAVPRAGSRSGRRRVPATSNAPRVVRSTSPPSIRYSVADRADARRRRRAVNATRTGAGIRRLAGAAPLSGRVVTGAVASTLSSSVLVGLGVAELVGRPVLDDVRAGARRSCRRRRCTAASPLVAGVRGTRSSATPEPGAVARRRKLTATGPSYQPSAPSRCPAAAWSSARTRRSRTRDGLEVLGVADAVDRAVLELVLALHGRSAMVSARCSVTMRRVGRRRSGTGSARRRRSRRRGSVPREPDRDRALVPAVRRRLGGDTISASVGRRGLVVRELVCAERSGVSNAAAGGLER